MSGSNFSQAMRLFFANIKLAYYLADRVAFAAFSATKFTPQFEIDFRNAITAVENILPDEAIVDHNTGRTTHVSDMKRKVQDYHARIKYFVEEAFPDDEATRNAIGLNDYSDAMRSVAGIGVYLNTLKKQVGIYSAPLIAHSMPAAMITELDQLTADFTDAYVDKSSGQKNRTVEAQNRHDAYELMDKFVTDVCKAGKVIFRNNPAMYSRYLIVVRSSSNDNKPIEIAANTEAPVFKDSIAPNTVFEISNEGDVALTFFVTTNVAAPTPTTALILAPGASTTVTAQNISDGNYNMLLVRNPSSKVGSYTALVLED